MAEQEGPRRRTQGVAGTWPPRGAAQGAALVPSGADWSSFLERLQAWVRAEAGAGRLLPWVPVAFGAGIALYFTAAREPVLSVSIATAVALCIGRLPVAAKPVLRGGRDGRRRLRRALPRRPSRPPASPTRVLARPIYSVSLSGFVETRDIRERTDRFVLRVTTMDAPRLSTKLERVRLSVKKGTAPDVGSFVELKARLLPPLAPLRPGSLRFFARHVLSGHRRLRLRDGRDQDHRAARERRAVVCAMPRSCRGCATPSTRASAAASTATSGRSRPRC